jgi:NADH-quinone oxidoreductase subunit C
MALENSTVQEKIIAKFGDGVKDFNESYGLLALEVDADKAIDLIQFLRDDETLRFNFLTDICAVHYPDNEVDRQMIVVYHLHNWLDNVRVRIKAYINGQNPEIETATRVFLAANWLERETYDYYGVIFTGHPDLKRILNMDEMVDFPMRKEFPMEDQGRTDKDDRYFGRIPVNNESVGN